MRSKESKSSPYRQQRLRHRDLSQCVIKSSITGLKSLGDAAARQSGSSPNQICCNVAATATQTLMQALQHGSARAALFWSSRM